jgi:hypothetical protein
MNVKKGRVTNAGEGGKTPIAGAPQHKELNMKGTRVKKSSEMPRKNDPPKKAADRMGLKMGTRVTSRETMKRG